MNFYGGCYGPPFLPYETTNILIQETFLKETKDIMIATEEEKLFLGKKERRRSSAQKVWFYFLICLLCWLIVALWPSSCLIQMSLRISKVFQGDYLGLTKSTAALKILAKYSDSKIVFADHVVKVNDLNIRDLDRWDSWNVCVRC